MCNWPWVRLATEADIPACADIAGKLRHELGFVRTDGLQRSQQRGYLYVAEVDGIVAGFVEFNRPTRGPNVGYSVVYHLAVDPNQRRNGIGRALLYSVRHPVRLKCPVDLAANAFYAASGMRLVDTLSGKARALNVWERRILCAWVQGNNVDIPSIAKAAGMAYGTRHVETPRAWPYMLDIHWRDYDWGEYLTMVKSYHPSLAMVADYERLEQRETMLQQVADLRAAGVLHIAVCPKFDGAVADIPADCIVAVSVPSKYAGFVPSDEELAGRYIHLLGGSPQKQMTYIRRWPGRVVSIDGNAHDRAAQYGVLFDGTYWHRPKHKSGLFNLKDVWLLSARNICAAAEKAAHVEQLSLGL